MRLGKRLKCVADLVTPVATLADIGCDHGFLSIHLMRNGICQRIIAADVNEGPLLRARENIDASGMGEAIETRLSNGLEAIAPGEADAFVIAGMGGELGLSILLRAKEKVAQAEYFIFQVQSELELVRYCFQIWGFAISEEAFIKERNGCYFAMRVIPSQEFTKLETGINEEAYLEEKRKSLRCLPATEKKFFYFPINIMDRYGDYPEYLNRENNRLKEILSVLKETDAGLHRREWEEVEEELEMLKEIRNEM